MRRPSTPLNPAKTCPPGNLSIRDIVDQAIGEASGGLHLPDVSLGVLILAREIAHEAVLLELLRRRLLSPDDAKAMVNMAHSRGVRPMERLRHQLDTLRPPSAASVGMRRALSQPLLINRRGRQ